MGWAKKQLTFPKGKEIKIKSNSIKMPIDFWNYNCNPVTGWAEHKNRNYEY